MKIEDRVLQLFDQHVANPKGLTLDQMTYDQGCSTVLTRLVIRKLREACAATDTVNLVCEPNPSDPNGQWLYRLAGNLDDARWWLSNRIGDAESRVRTLQDVTSALSRSADGRTAEGRRVRIIDRALTRLVEDLDELAV